MKLAEKGIEDLQQYVDTLLTIPNQNFNKSTNNFLLKIPVKYRHYSYKQNFNKKCHLPAL